VNDLAKQIRDFINNSVDSNLIQRDFYISPEIDEAYLSPLAKAWAEYKIRKRDIIFLSIVIAKKYENQLKKIDKLDCEKLTKSGKRVDMGRLSDFNDAELTFLVSILISKYGIDDVVNNIGQRWEDLRVMAEQGIKVLYCKIYKEKTIDIEIFNTILNLDELEI
jgi:hypothetical protein